MLSMKSYRCVHSYLGPTLNSHRRFLYSVSETEKVPKHLKVTLSQLWKRDGEESSTSCKASSLSLRWSSDVRHTRTECDFICVVCGTTPPTPIPRDNLNKYHVRVFTLYYLIHALSSRGPYRNRFTFQRRTGIHYFRLKNNIFYW